MQKSFGLSLVWDGILPLMTTAIPWIVWLLPGDQFAAVLTVLLLPILAACIRGPIGEMQIAQICGERSSALRQIAMGAAIASLMALDVITTAWILAPPQVAPGLWPAAVSYVAYLVFIAFALAPSSATRDRLRRLRAKPALPALVEPEQNARGG